LGGHFTGTHEVNPRFSRFGGVVFFVWRKPSGLSASSRRSIPGSLEPLPSLLVFLLSSGTGAGLPFLVRVGILFSSPLALWIFFRGVRTKIR